MSFTFLLPCERHQWHVEMISQLDKYKCRNTISLVLVAFERPVRSANNLRELPLSEVAACPERLEVSGDTIIDSHFLKGYICALDHYFLP